MPWQPGQSGNPAGAPTRIKPWREALMRALKREQRLLFHTNRLHPSIIATHDENGVCIVPEGQMLELIADMTVQRAACGDHDATLEIGNRLDGRAPQTLEGGDAPIIHTVKWLDDDDETSNGLDVENIAESVSGEGASSVDVDPPGEPVGVRQLEYDDRWADEIEEAEPKENDDDGSTK